MSAAALANTLGVPSAARVLTQGRRRKARAMKRASVQVRARASPDEESPVFRAWDQATNSKKRDDIKKIMILGAGPIVIGQACEFDYSGTQACKSLRAEGRRQSEVILLHSNPNDDHDRSRDGQPDLRWSHDPRNGGGDNHQGEA